MATKLEWQCNSDGDRWFANVEDGQFSLMKGITKWWFVEWMFITDDAMRKEFRLDFQDRRFARAEYGQKAIEDWYTQHKERT
jgi:hypothetical protein